MRTFAAVAALMAVFSLPAAAGGKACQVADSAVPTPGLRELAMGSSIEPVPDGSRLTAKQIERLAEADTAFRREMKDVAARCALLPAGESKEPDAAGKALPDLVALFLARSVRDAAILIDPEGEGAFGMANAAAMARWRMGDKEGFCALCIGVRRGMEAAFAWEPGKFGELTAEQEQAAVALAARRQELRQKWAAILKEELTAEQLEWLRRAQMRWLKDAVRDSVTAGLKRLDAATCESCAKDAVEMKCEFCGIVMAAVDAAKRPVTR